MPVNVTRWAFKGDECRRRSRGTVQTSAIQPPSNWAFEIIISPAHHGRCVCVSGCVCVYVCAQAGAGMDGLL